MGNSSTTKPDTLDEALAKIPTNFRRKIIDTYAALKQRHAQAKFSGSWDSSGISAGKFCEAVLRFLQHHLTGRSTPSVKRFSNFPDECNNIIKAPVSSGPESLRVIAPRALVFLYTLRGKRGIGHVSGDIEANEIDADVMAKVCDWVVCELIRIFHQLPIEEAQDLLDMLTRRQTPKVWSVGGKRRVLRTDLGYQEQTLLLLYGDPRHGVLAEDLHEWTEHSNYTVFKSSVLAQLHKKRLIEYDKDDDLVYLSPLGESLVEKDILGPAPIVRPEKIKNSKPQGTNRRASGKPNAVKSNDS